jgi:hypothetical protein
MDHVVDNGRRGQDMGQRTAGTPASDGKAGAMPENRPGIGSKTVFEREAVSRRYQRVI